MIFCPRKKKCFAEGCTARVPRRLLMCRAHWFLVPHELRVEVYATLDVWQSGGSPKAYLTAIQRARVAVAEAVARNLQKSLGGDHAT